ncbi:host specificity factor TipJ family phage tail protein [Methylorubrum extorquens]|uniref:host specificity factor TipJ family phage tail protein n=1 Tax=Methylorubrum extorquens TaxID=408 RepID=UPI003F5E57CA
MTALVRAPLCGEVLGAADAVTVIAALHPTSPARETLVAPAGLSIAEIVELALAHRPVGMRRAIRASIGTDAVPQERWRSIRPRAGTVIVLRAVPGSGAGGLFRTIAMLAVAILTAFVAPYLTPILGTLGTAIVTAAITVGAGLLINALFPVNAKKADTGQVYSIAGNQNLATPYQPIPMLHGRMRVYPRYAGSAYSEFEGDNQFLRLLYLWSYGPVDVGSLKLGETPLDAYHDVEVETFDVAPGGPQPSLYPMTVVQRDLNIEVKQVDGWTTRTTSDDCTEWALDFGCPNGLSATKASGDVITLTVQIEIEQSVAYAEDWQPVQVLSLSGRSTKPIRVTVRRPVEAGTYDIRWRRSTPDTEGNPKLISATVVTAMRSYKAGQPITFGKPITVTALRIRATSQLSGVIDNLNAVCTGRLKVWNGTTWVAGATSSNPADQLIRVLQGAANARPIADARIDWITIQEWHAWCASRGYAYNKLHVELQSVLTTAQDVASAGRAAIVFRDGLWSVVWDAADAPIVAHFTPRNSWGFRGKRSYRRLPHAYRVKFKNEDRDWRDDEIVVYADGYSAATATLFEELEFPGQTDHALNWRHGRYHDAQIRLRPEDYFLSVDIENLVCTRGDRVRVTHMVPAWGLGSGRVVAILGDRVALDEDVTMVAGRDYCVRFRLADETSIVWRVVTTPGTVSDLQLTGGTDDAPRPAAGDLAMFGEVGQETVVLRVKKITPGEDLSAELHLVDDAPGIAQADQGTPPDVIDVPATPDPSTRQPINVRASEGSTGAAGGYVPTVTLLWETPVGGPLVDRFEVALKGPGNADYGLPVSVPATERHFTWQNLPPGPTALRVRSVFAEGSPLASNWASTTLQVVSWSLAPPPVTGLAAQIYAGQALFSWDAPESDVARTELRYTPATSGATWESAGNPVSRADGTSVPVPYAAGTYLAKHVNGGGVYGNDATALVLTAASLPGQAAGEVFDYAPFSGAHAFTVEADGGVRLADDGAGGVVPAGFYTPTEFIDLGGVFLVRVSGSLITHGLDLSASAGAPDIYGVDPSGWSAEAEVRTTRDEPWSPSATWTEWAKLVPGDVQARGLAVRVSLASLADRISPVVELVQLRAEVEARTVGRVGVSVPAEGTRVTFDPPFQAVPALSVTGLDLASGDRLTIANRDGGGADLRVFNSAGTAVGRTVDLIACGFGARVA